MALEAAPYRNGLGLVAVPDGSRIGDGVMIVTAGSDSASIGQGADQFHTTIEAAPGGDPGMRYFLGKLTTLDPIEINVTSGTGVRSEHAQIVTVHGKLDLDSVTRAYASSDTTSPVATIPDVSITVGAVVLATMWSGIGGSRWGGVSGGGTTWVSNESSNTYHGVNSAWTPGPVNGSVSVTNLGLQGFVGGLIVGVRPLSSDAPPCRIFPRSDGLGVGAGRAYPPPKSQQRSPGNRGVGYY